MTICNFERFLAPCLDAYVAQTVQPLEYILVDDGSSDRTPDILKEYAARFPDLFRVILLPQNVGLNRALSQGMREVTTEYVYTAAADDFPGPGFIECLRRGNELFPEASLVTVNYRLWLDDGKSLPDREPLPRFLDSDIRISQTVEYLSPEHLAARVRMAVTHPIGLAMYRREDWLASPALNRGLRHYQDLLLNYSNAFRGGIVYFPEPQLDFRLALNSYGNRGRYDSLREISTCRRLLQVLLEPGLDDVRPVFFASQVFGFLGWRFVLAALSLPASWKYLPRLFSRKLLTRGTYLDLRYLLGPLYRRIRPLLGREPGIHDVTPT